jgi:hypothetical protein
MGRLNDRLQLLELSAKNKTDSYTIWRNEGESEEQARHRAGVPDDADMVVMLTWQSGELPDEKRGLVRW